eukprot:6173952-Pleurochrysis_carterae.AAC.1
MRLTPQAPVEASNPPPSTHRPVAPGSPAPSALPSAAASKTWEPPSSPLQLGDADIGVDNVSEAPDSNYVADLQRWLQSQNLPICGLNKDDLVGLVQHKRAQDKKYGIVNALQPPTCAPGNWMCGLVEVCRSSPLLAEGVIHTWAHKEKLIYKVDGKAFYGESFKHGATRSMNNPSIDVAISKQYEDHLGRQVCTDNCHSLSRLACARLY